MQNYNSPGSPPAPVFNNRIYKTPVIAIQNLFHLISVDITSVLLGVLQKLHFCKSKTNKKIKAPNIKNICSF